MISQEKLIEAIAAFEKAMGRKATPEDIEKLSGGGDKGLLGKVDKMGKKKDQLTAMGFNTQNFSEEQLEKLTPEQMAELARASAPKGQQGQQPLLGGPSGQGEDVVGEPSPSTIEPEKGTSGTPGTWETAMMAVSRTIPSIIQASQFRRPYAPAANIGGRRTMDIPSAASTFGKNDPRFQSLLAMFLKR